MTASTGKRSYRACVRCRRRKTKCDLGGIGEPRKIPCVSCFESDSECVLAESRRGGNFRTYEPTKKSTRSHKASQRTSPRITRSTEKEVDRSLDGLNEDVIDEQLASELRNPSDALHILAQSEKSKASGSPVLPNEEEHDGLLRGPSNVVSVDEYELVQRGLVNHSNISELLHLYSQNYHSYCPIVPAYMLGQSGIDKIRTSDFFLLTVISTIASRDSSTHSLIHRYCWDYTQKLLLEVLLGYPWTLKSRTVESLLLLSEWLPHIELTQSVSNESKSMFIEDRTSWSLVGLAVRQAYLMRLDQGAFPNVVTQETKEQVEHKRLIWTFVYIADRQISVRLGQSFWSRGPSLSTRLTAKDFPSLQPAPNSNQEDYASAHQATMELTQLMHNAQAILYSSPKRTLAMVHDGDYSRYLDDFQRASMNWHATWSDLAVSARVKRSLSLVYEYLCLYVNAFSFQAVLTRMSTQNTFKQSFRPFINGIMNSSDGRYVWDAITAAINTLKLMTDFHPQHELCYLPYRYYLADCAGAFQPARRRQETTSLVLKFISVLDGAASDKFHISHRYSQLLRNLWHREERKISKARSALATSTSSAQAGTAQQQEKPDFSPATLSSLDHPHGQHDMDNLANADLPINQIPTMSQELPDFSPMQDYPFGPFISIPDFELGDFGNPISDMSLPSLNWGAGLVGMDPIGQ
ncbi:hypothetical protein CFAM422_012566 [Trichoderma lentiforme]|uniref:Zn(2)-C6 fungal-type domain-containing protein n=1 Tax=Trichoderma lentiforme TaxID=1567552 RepID=A0A9P4X4U1_9HYPO|nr:hypothetical protein CFAM422_012566 [Trichoderma lentiforme]